MRIAVYGGSFVPPHLGHAMVAAWVLWTDRAAAVWLLPCASHPFDKEMAPFENRLGLCEKLAAVIGGGVSTCSVEHSLPAPNYTWDTLCHLADAHTDHVFELLVGADTLQQVHLWHRWVDIADRFGPIIVGRQGYPDRDDAPTFPDFSSTEVRDRLAQGLPVGHLVPSTILGELDALYGKEGG